MWAEKAIDERVAWHPNTAIIGIVSPEQPHVFADGGNVKTFRFDDEEPFKSRVPENCMSHEQAHELFSFLAKVHADPAEIELHVHCEAGVSRSGAVVTFVQEWLRLDYDEFRRMNPQIVPNLHVLKQLRRVAYESEPGVY
jgi:predicted protein tyrosine phosphatase